MHTHRNYLRLHLLLSFLDQVTIRIIFLFVKIERKEEGIRKVSPTRESLGKNLLSLTSEPPRMVHTGTVSPETHWSFLLLTQSVLSSIKSCWKSFDVVGKSEGLGRLNPGKTLTLLDPMVMNFKETDISRNSLILVL